MHRVLELVFRYRQLLGKCETGAGLDFGEIPELTELEVELAGETRRHDGPRRLGERDFSRAAVELQAELRRGRFRDTVTIAELGPGGFVCEGGPFLQREDRVEVVVAMAAPVMSVRFMAEIAWTRDRDVDCVLGFRVLGVPLAIRHPAPPMEPARARRPSAPPTGDAKRAELHAA